MAARLIDGKALALQVRERLATESAAVLAKTGMKPVWRRSWWATIPPRISM